MNPPLIAPLLQQRSVILVILFIFSTLRLNIKPGTMNSPVKVWGFKRRNIRYSPWNLFHITLVENMIIFLVVCCQWDIIIFWRVWGLWMLNRNRQTYSMVSVGCLHYLLCHTYRGNLTLKLNQKKNFTCFIQ